MNVYPNLYALLESDSHARRLFEHAPSQVRRQLLTRRQAIRSVAALDAAIAVRENGVPVCILAKTVKGKGVSFMENQAGWHGQKVSGEDYKNAMEELKGGR